jgi:hypothetical protein
VAELFRTFQRRRFDFPVIASIGVGAVGIVFNLPFMEAAKQFRGHYGTWDMLGAMSIQLAYLIVLLNLKAIHGMKNVDMRLYVFIVILVGVSICIFLCRLSRKTLTAIEPQEVFVLALAALPFFGYLLAFFASSTLEPRFVVGLVIGIAAITAIGLFSLCRSERVETFIIAVLFVTIASTGITHVYLERMATQRIRSSMVLPPQIKAALMASPSNLVYIQDMENFGAAVFYEQDADVRSRIALVYSETQEVKWNQESVIAQTASHLSNFAPIKTIPYESLTAQAGDHIFVEYGGTDKPIGWNWIGRAFAAGHADVKPLGSAFCGNGELMGKVVSVRFLP